MGVGCERLTELSEGSRRLVQSRPSLVSHSEPHTTTHHPSGTVRLFASLVVPASRSLGQESCPVVTFLSQPLLNSAGMVAVINPDQHSLKSIELIRRNEADG